MARVQGDATALGFMSGLILLASLFSVSIASYSERRQGSKTSAPSLVARVFW